MIINNNKACMTCTIHRQDNDGFHLQLSLTEDEMNELVRQWIEHMIDISKDTNGPTWTIIRTDNEGFHHQLALTDDEMNELVRLWTECL